MTGQVSATAVIGILRDGAEKREGKRRTGRSEAEAAAGGRVT